MTKGFGGVNAVDGGIEKIYDPNIKKHIIQIKCKYRIS